MRVSFAYPENYLLVFVMWGRIAAYKGRYSRNARIFLERKLRGQRILTKAQLARQALAAVRAALGRPAFKSSPNGSGGNYAAIDVTIDRRARSMVNNWLVDNSNDPTWTGLLNPRLCRRFVRRLSGGDPVRWFGDSR
jgi:hypothetical protein